MGLGRYDSTIEGGTSQSLRCFSGRNLSGQQIQIKEQNIEDLGTMKFDNKAFSCCFNGVWVLYDEKSYNQNHYNVSCPKL